MIEFCSSRRRLLMAGWLILSPLVLAGCGSKKRASVEGKITIDGVPANSGHVTFTTVDGKGRISSMMGDIQPDGTYRVFDAPLGAVKVSVTPLVKGERGRARKVKDPVKLLKVKGQQDVPQAAPAPAGPVVPIPKKYANADTSGLTTTINPGTNIYDIELSSH